MKRKLGKTPARKDAVKFKFMRYADPTALPTPPLRFGRGLLDDWFVLGNSDYGNCVWAGAAHETMSWNKASRGRIIPFTDKAVLSDYAKVTGFNPKDPDTDNGTDMQEAASYRRKTGILDANGIRHKIESYIALDIGDPDELALAAYLFGCAGIGLQYPKIADKQFDAQQPWSIGPNDKSAIVGGHYVPVVGRNSKGNFLVVTWGRLHAMTPDFYRRYCDEAIAYLSPEMFNDQLLSADGFDIATLRKDLKAI